MTAKKKPSLFKRLWDGLFKSGRPVYMEDKTAASQKAKRRHKQANKSHSKPQPKAGKKASTAATSELSPDQPAYWGYVDAKGHVRLKSSEQILGKSNRSKKAALAEFAAIYEDQQARLARLEALDQAKVLESEHWQGLEALAEDIKRRPGLGDLPALQARLAALQARVSEAAASIRQRRQALLDELSLLSQRAKVEDVSADLAALEQQWQGLTVMGSPEEAPLVLRFERSAKAIRQLQNQVDRDQGGLSEEGEALLGDLEALVADSAWQAAQTLLNKKATRRALIERALGVDMRRRLGEIEAVIEANVADEVRQHQTALAKIDAQRQAILEALTQHIETRGWHGDAGAFAQMKRDWQALNSDGDLINPTQDLAFAQLSARLQDALREERDERAERKQEVAQTRQELLDALEGWLKTARAAKDAKGWVAVDEAVASIKQAWQDQAVAANAAERQALASGLDALAQARQDYYERQSQNRDKALEKKRILIDDVTKFSPSLGSKELRQHLADSLEAWKAAGSAGREYEDDLWEAYNAARETVRQEIERLRGVEANEAAERLSGAFAAKKERQAQLENLIMVDELLNESKPSKSLEKQIEKKRTQVRELQDQMMDIQRRLRELAKLAATRSAGEEAPEAAADDTAGERDGLDGPDQADAQSKTEPVVAS